MLQIKSKLRRISKASTISDYRITRGYAHWLFDLFWNNVDGPMFDCLIEWSQDDILLLQTIRLLGRKYRDKVAELFPRGFGVKLNPIYYYKTHVDLNDDNAHLVNAPVFLDGLVKIRIVHRLCRNGCYGLGIKYDLGTNSRELVIVEIIRDLKTPPGLTIFCSYFNDIMDQKYKAFHQVLRESLSRIYHVDRGRKLYPRGDMFHYFNPNY